MTRSPPRWALLALLLMAVMVMTGCGTYRLDNAVQSFSSLQSMPAQPTYRFEWLPSQRGRPEQALLESFADAALFQAGLRRDDAAPRYSVQLGAGTQPVLSPWADPWFAGGWGLGVGARRSRGLGVGIGVGGPFYPRGDQLWYHREVRVLVRDLSSNQVVYETSAVNEGPWFDGAQVFPAMFAAAMQGFPNPPAGVRRVDVEVGAR